MRTLNFVATLLTDAVVNEFSATAGGHTSLSYLPGAAFLGHCASRLYTVAGANAFDLFHSGAVRFGNAYPLAPNGCPAIPVPLSWHYRKEATYAENNRLHTGSIHNLVHLSPQTKADWKSEGVQPKQIREGFFALDGSYILPSFRYCLKTAVDRTAGGRARDSQLFGYASLTAGSRWHFTVELDDNLTKELDGMIEKAVAGQVRIGRSRSAEYGLTEVVRTAGAEATTPVSSEFLVIYCLSDLALRDKKTGAPVLVPEAGHFRMDAEKLVSEKCFIRTRAYAPFNAKRRANDLERQVICKGSVITFRPAGPFDAGALQKALLPGVGMYRQDGLGRVLVNPPFLSMEVFMPARQEKPAAPAVNAVAIEVSRENSLLTNWMIAKDVEENRTREIMALVADYVGLLADIIKKNKGTAPSKSQWSRLRDIALQSSTAEDLKRNLFDKEKGHCTHGVSERKWSREDVKHDGHWMTYRHFLEDVVLKNARNLQESQQFLYLLGVQLPHRLNQEEK